MKQDAVKRVLWTTPRYSCSDFPAQSRQSSEINRSNTSGWPLRLNLAPHLVATDVANARRIVARETPPDNDGVIALSSTSTGRLAPHSNRGGSRPSSCEPRAAKGQRTQFARGSHEKKRNAAIKPPTPQAATTMTSVQLNGVPMKPAWSPEAK